MSANDVSDLKSLVINGELVKSSSPTMKSINPANGETNYEIPIAQKDEVDEAVRTADEAASRPEWRDMFPHDRAALLGRVADVMEKKAEAFAAAQQQENGKVTRECIAQAKSSAAYLRYFGALCETLGGDLTPQRGRFLTMSTYEPYGVVAAITPWNSPLTMHAQKIAPALAAGNAVVLKPSEITSYSALLLGEAALEAGVPPGILNVITGDGKTTGNALLAHPAVRMAAFTGGTTTGRHIAVSCAQRLIPCVLELGGKSPHIVFADADIPKAVESICGGIFEGTGQSCVAGSRLFVEKSIYDRLMSALLERASRIRVGMPDDSQSTIGPLASFMQRDRVEAFVNSARDDGGDIVLGGSRPEGKELQGGAFYSPTIVTGLSNSDRTASEEIFGPVLCVMQFSDEADLIRQANDTAYGLAAGVWTADYRRALRVARAIQAGTVWINTYKKLSISTPLGGYKDSGIGREKGVAGFRAYQQIKSIYWSLD